MDATACGARAPWSARNRAGGAAFPAIRGRGRARMAVTSARSLHCKRAACVIASAPTRDGMGEEARKHARAKITGVTVRYERANGEETFDAKARDIGQGGVFIETNAPLPANERVTFEIRIAGET